MSSSLSSDIPAAAPASAGGLARLPFSLLRYPPTTTGGFLFRHYRASPPPTPYRCFDHLSLPIHSFVNPVPPPLINRLLGPVPSPPSRRSPESGENSGEPPGSIAFTGITSAELTGESSIKHSGENSGELALSLGPENSEIIQVEVSGTSPDENSKIAPTQDSGPAPAAGRRTPGASGLPSPITTSATVPTTSSWSSRVRALRQSSIISQGNTFNLGVFVSACALLLGAAGTTMVAEFASKHNPKKSHASVLATVPVFQTLNGYTILSVFILMLVVCKKGFASHKFSRAVVFFLFLAGLAEFGAFWILVIMGCGLETGPAPYIWAGVFALLLVLLFFCFGPPYTTTTSTIRTNGDDHMA